QQLNRMATAARAYGGLTSDAGRAYAGASDLYGAGLGTLQTTGMLPYSTYLGQANDLGNALGTFSGGTQGAFGIPQNLLNNLQSYLQTGQSAADVGRLAAANRFGNNLALGNNLGASLQALGGPLNKLFGGGGGGGGGGGSYAYNGQALAGYAAPASYL